MFKAIKVRGYDSGHLGYDKADPIGTFNTKDEAQKAADEYSARMRPNNSPACYDFGMVLDAPAS